jgi:photosystem II stability/assembly factor-like uncharacterized protein
MKKHFLLSLLLLITQLGFSQSKTKVNPKNYQSLQWRNIGPFRGGRSLAVSGVVSEPNTYYFGGAGAGIWKSIDAGANWESISDSSFKSSSVGAIAVAPTNKNIIYAGMGEAEIRGNISFGDGMYKSTNAGKSWKKIGLEKADAISTIQIHPKNHDIVFVSAMGNPFGKNPERGIYRTKDGGKNWQLVLSKNDSTGAADVKIDPSNPDVVYASLWQGFRNGFMMSSGGINCGLYKSTDGGDSWTLLSHNPGLPTGLLGKIGIAVSPVNSNRVWAMIENIEKGGLYRSDDGGETWQLMNEDKNLRQRPWYYSMIHADPTNADGLIVTNVNIWRTKDAGKSFSRIQVGHGDTHDVWWNPSNSENFIVGDDGGAEVTYNGGATFSALDIPTAQFYHVSIDNAFPYNVYGAQQDNSSIRIASRTFDSDINQSNWWSVAGGEAGYITADPLNNDITYGGEYDGSLTKYYKSINHVEDVSVYPESNMGAGASEKKFRFQWTYPIVFSKHDPKRLFIGSQFVHTSIDGGKSWEVISPDLTTNDLKKQIRSGGPITKDNTGAEVHCTVFTFAESPVKQGLYWAGSDDGLIHTSADAGKNWTKVNDKSMPTETLISILEPSNYEEKTCFVALTKYRYGDKKPYIYKTKDAGKTWKLIVNGIPADEYVRVIREDPNTKGMLYAGTERGIWVSFDEGDNWQKLQLNLPITPIHDIAIHKEMKDIIVATHGRSFWILDDVSPLYDEKIKNSTNDIELLKPSNALLMDAYSHKSKTVGENPKNGVNIHYLINKETQDEVILQFLNMKGDTINTISTKKSIKGKEKKVDLNFFHDETKISEEFLNTKIGLNSYNWDLRYPEPVEVKGTNILWNGSGETVKVTPGTYKVRLIKGKTVVGEQNFEVKKNPLMKCSDADLEEQFTLLTKVNGNISTINKTINDLRKVKEQLNAFVSKLSDSTQIKAIKTLSDPMIKSLDEIESNLMQPKALASQDVLAVPIQLNDKMGSLSRAIYSAEGKPNKQSFEVYEMLTGKMNVQLDKFKKIKTEDLKALNDKIDSFKIPALLVK